MSKFWFWTVLILVLSFAFNARIAAAHATPAQDEQFYTLLARDGLQPNTYTIGLAHQICANVWSGVDPYSEVSRVWKSSNLTWDDATHFVADSILVYCPPSGSGTRSGGGTSV